MPINESKSIIEIKNKVFPAFIAVGVDRDNIENTAQLRQLISFGKKVTNKFLLMFVLLRTKIIFVQKFHWFTNMIS